MQGLLGTKEYQTQAFLQDGTRVPLTAVSVMGNFVTQLKTEDKEGYNAVQLGFEIKKRRNKAILGHLKKAGVKSLPRFFREVRTSDVPSLELGSQISPSSIFKEGDIVDVAAVSKGKGFAGVVKRHHFKGGPRTHGQSDRERAPGSIGQTTTPGRVYKGKRMAGRMGHEQVTVKNLLVLDVTNDGVLLIKGLLPGALNNLVVVRKIGESKKFVPLWKEVIEDEKPATTEIQNKTESQNLSASENLSDSGVAREVSAGVNESGSEPEEKQKEKEEKKNANK